MSSEAEYIKWNQLPRHQIIVAHLTLIDGAGEAIAKLAAALDTTTTFGLIQLVDMAVERIKQKEAELALATAAAWSVRDLCACKKISQADIDAAVDHAQKIRTALMLD